MNYVWSFPFQRRPGEHEKLAQDSQLTAAELGLTVPSLAPNPMLVPLQHTPSLPDDPRMEAMRKLLDGRMLKKS